VRARLAVRGLSIVAAVVLAVGLVASPAWAHVEVSADKPQAGATNVTVTFTSEAESGSAGIMAEQITLPAGITPNQVRLATGPAGWVLTPEASGFKVGGPALPVGTDAVFSVVIAQLPATATELIFKVIETYSDGMIVRWIDETQPGQPEPDHPAPILRLAAAAPGTASTTTAAPAPTTTVPAPTSAPVEDTADTSGNNGSIWWLIGAGIIVVGAVVAALLVRRRSSPPTDGLEQ
jgi:Domain of unkown function (DUF1775)